MFFIDLKGGRLQNKTLTSTTEIIHADGTVEDGKDLPKKSDGHCMVLLPPGIKVKMECAYVPQIKEQMRLGPYL